MRLEPQEREPRHHGMEIGNVNYHSLNLSEIDQRALDGSFWLVFSGQTFAVARFDGREWVHSSGTPAGMTPTHYHRGGHG